MPGAKLPILTITNKQYFRDDGLYIDGLTDGTLNITSDSAITLDGNVSLTTGDTLTLVDGAVDLGTGALTVGGNLTVAGTKYIEFTTGAESMRWPNDATIASGQWWNSGAAMWKTNLASGNVCGWVRVKVASGASNYHTMYAPLYSSNTMSD